MSHLKTVNLKKYLGNAGAGLDESVNSKDTLRQLLTHMVNGQNNRVVDGLQLGAPTTPSAQLTGSGNTSWRVNIAAGRAKVGAVAYAPAAQADVVVHSGSNLLASGQSAIAAIVAKVAAGSVSLVAVKGAAATTGAQKAPTDGEIQLAVGDHVKWVKIGETTLNRTADTTVTQTYDNTKADVDAPISVEA